MLHVFNVPRMSGPAMWLIKRFLILVAILVAAGAATYLAVWDVPSPMRTIVEDVPDDRFDD